MRNYPESIDYYKKLLELHAKEDERAEFLFRIAKSYYHLWKFNDAVKTYQQIAQLFPETELAEKASFQIGMTYFTGGNESFDFESGNAYQKAIQSFESFIKKYPKSLYGIEAKFGIASCLEEMDHLDEALQKYEEIKEVYPSPKVRS